MASPTPTVQEEDQRRAFLQDAENKANSLFTEIEKTLIRSGVSEAGLSKEIHQLAADRYGVTNFWHKRVVRSGPNTLKPYQENPPDRTIEEDDILFIDLGPIFEAWEADFGRTFVLGNDPMKLNLRNDLEPVWREVKSRFDRDEGMTGEGLYDAACEVAREKGWEFGGKIAGHIIGQFPHERIPKDMIRLYITKGNGEVMRRRSEKNGLWLHWILEIHLVDREREIGGFMEQLLTIG